MASNLTVLPTTDTASSGSTLISIGSSGLFGHTSVPMYYPEPATDFIFTSFASSYGLILTILFLITILSFDLCPVGDLIDDSFIKSSGFIDTIFCLNSFILFNFLLIDESVIHLLLALFITIFNKFYFMQQILENIYRIKIFRVNEI